MNDIAKRVPHVVIVGGGFGGLTAAQSLAHAPVKITLIDRTNHHLFQPLLYQVATAGLSPAEIASPIRSILSRQANAAVLLDEVTGVDLARKRLSLRDESLDYDYLILATGTQTNYFGHDAWEKYAPGLKSIDDAVEVRRRVLLAFEAAEREHDPAKRARLLTLVAIGGGPTGVELAGALAELAKFVLARDFRSINPRSARVVLVEAGGEILASFGDELSHKARRQLEDLGVEVRTGARVTCIDDAGVELVVGDGAEPERIGSATVVWAAGVRATSITASLGVATDRIGRVPVGTDCSVEGHPDVFAIGDMASFTHQEGGKPLPGVSPVAMQQARSVAKNIVRTMRGEAREPFRYFDKGTMATIGRSRAVAESRGIKMSGLIAWLAWLLVHIWYLIGFRNRFIVMFSWFWSYVAYKRGARLITGHRLEPGRPRDEVHGALEDGAAHPPAARGVRQPDVIRGA